MYGFLADAVVFLHLGFVLFVAGGGFLVLRWPGVAWFHVPAATWGAAIEFGGWVCPLTPLENWFRIRAGEAGYGGGFVEEYLLPVLYPGDLTREIQIALGMFVVVVNGAVYLRLWLRSRRKATRPGNGSGGG